MKKFKIVINVITVALLVGGLVPCVWNYADHALNCHGCSAHGAHPLIELLSYGVIVLFAGTVWGVSRLIMRLWGKKNAADSNGISPKMKSKQEKRRDILILALLVMGFFSFLSCLIYMLIRNSWSIDILNMLACIVYMTPFVWAAEVVFIVSRLIMLRQGGKDDCEFREKLANAKAEKIVCILILVILFAGLVNHIYMFIQDLKFFDSFSNTVFDMFMMGSMYMIPYMVLSAVILGVKRLVLSRKAKAEKRKVSA